MDIVREYEYLQNIDLNMVKDRLPRRSDEGNKGTFGTLLCICGSVGMTGAAIMSSSAAIRCGVGIVKLIVPDQIYDITAKHLVEPIFSPIHTSDEGTLDSLYMEDIMKNFEKCTACLMGCGLGWNSDIKKIVYNVIEKSEIPLVIDADGINVISENINILKSAKSDIIITPHIGEMARLCKKEIEDLKVNKEKYARGLSKEYGITVVLKSDITTITDSNGNTFVNRKKNSGMAKGGSGDVLAGIIGSFLSQRMKPIDAAICGVYIHSLAGEKCANDISKTSMLPTDIINELPNIFLKIER